MKMSLSKRRALATLGIVVIAIVVFLLVRAGRKQEIPLAKVSHGEFIVKIVRSGEIKAEKSLTVTAPSLGEKLLITRLVPEGTYVKKGDFLIQFDPTDLLNKIESAKRELVGEKADLELTKAKNELRKKELEEEVRQKAIETRRAEGGSPIEFESAERALELAQVRYETELKVMETEVIKREIDIERAEERVSSAKKNLKELTVLAPGDGIVIHETVWRGGRPVKVQEGDSPWPMQPIISLPDLGTLYVNTDIDEIDISRIAVGQRCVLTLEAYPDTSFEGHIGIVGNLARSKYSTSGPNIFDVSVEIDEVDPRFRPGMMTKAEIIVDVFDEEMFLPIEAIFEKDGEPVVYVRRGGSFEERRVEVGKRNDTHVIIASGLSGKEEIALVDPTEEDQG